MKVVLELLDQPSNIRRITVRHDIVIGRGADCNLRLSAPQISRRHCFMRVGRDVVSVTDLDSSNGTYLNGTRIESGRRYDVADGVTLALGPIRFVVAVRPEQVAAEVLQPSTLDESVDVSPHHTGTGGSTIMDAEPQSPAAPQKPASSTGGAYSIEQGGAVADENEPTADMSETNSDDLVMDSEAEIIDLGKRLAEHERSQQFRSEDPPDSAPPARRPHAGGSHDDPVDLDDDTV